MSIDRQMDKEDVTYTHTMEYCSVIKKNEITPCAATGMYLQIIILSGVSQTEKDKYHMISFIRRILKNDTNELIYGYQRGYQGRDKLGVWD